MGKVKLPVCSGIQVVKALRKIGYEVDHHIEDLQYLIIKKLPKVIKEEDLLWKSF